MKVLVGIDGSEASWEALSQAASLMSMNDALGLYYAPPDVAVRRAGRLPAGTVDRAQKALADSVMAEGMARIPEALRPHAEQIVGELPPRQGLPLAADQWRADLVAVGSTGAGGLPAAILGSVPRSLIHATNIPVLIARKRLDKQSDGIYRALLCVNQTPALTPALSLLNQVHWPAGGQGEVLHVVEPLFGAELPEWLIEKRQESEMSKAWLAEHDAEKRQMYDEMQQFSKKLPPFFASSAPVVVEGIPAKKILETARNSGTDLIIVGTRGLGTIERFLLGTTTERLVAQAPCSLLVMHYGATP